MFLGGTDAFYGILRLFMEDNFYNATGQLASRDKRQSAKIAQLSPAPQPPAEVLRFRIQPSPTLQPPAS